MHHLAAAAIAIVSLLDVLIHYSLVLSIVEHLRKSRLWCLHFSFGSAQDLFHRACKSITVERGSTTTCQNALTEKSALTLIYRTSVQQERAALVHGCAGILTHALSKVATWQNFLWISPILH